MKRFFRFPPLFAVTASSVSTVPVFNSFSLGHFTSSSSVLVRHASASSSINSALDLDDDEQDRLFLETLRKQQQQTPQQQQQQQPPKTDLEIKREKTNQFLNIIVDVGVITTVPSPSHSSLQQQQQHYHLLPSSSDPEIALQMIRDMITASVKLKTLSSNHIRRLFALCGARQKEDPSREMWIRMLSVVETIKEAERDLYFSEHDLYDEQKKTKSGDFKENNNSKSATDDSISDDSSLPPVIVTPEAWNALLGLSVEFVIRKRLRRGMDEANKTNTNFSQRAVLQSELESLLGPSQSEEPHWWILNRMDKEDIAVTNKNVIKFLASEVSITVPSSSGSNNNKEEDVFEVDAKTAKKLQASMKKNVLASRVRMVEKLF